MKMKFFLCVAFWVAVVAGAGTPKTSTQRNQGNNDSPPAEQSPVNLPQYQTQVRYIPVNVGSFGGFNTIRNPIFGQSQTLTNAPTQYNLVPVSLSGGGIGSAGSLIGQSQTLTNAPTQFNFIPVTLSGGGLGSGGSLVGQSQTLTNAPTQFRLVPVSLSGGGIVSNSGLGFGQGFLIGGNTGLFGGGWTGLQGTPGFSGLSGGQNGLSLIDFIKKKK